MLKHGDFVALDVYHFKRQSRHDEGVPLALATDGCLQPLFVALYVYQFKRQACGRYDEGVPL